MEFEIDYAPGVGVTGLRGTTGATIINAPSTPCNSPCNVSSITTKGYTNPSDDLSVILPKQQQDIESLKTKVDLLEIQLKFMLNKFKEVEKFMGSKKD